MGGGIARAVSTWWNSRWGRRFVIELAVCFVLLWIYRYVRFLARDQLVEAFANARRVVRLEQFAGVFVEDDLQRIVIDSRPIVAFLNRYYVTAHFSTTVVCLLFLYVRRPTLYPHIRRVLVMTTFVGMILHVVFPLAPPRMLSWHGFVDTLERWGPTVYSADTMRSTANQFAAMPSLHFGWAVIVAYAVLRAFRSRWRYVALVHPFLTLAAIVLTANHYLVDAAVAGVLVAVAVGADAAGRAVLHRSGGDEVDADHAALEPVGRSDPIPSPG